MQKTEKFFIFSWKELVVIGLMVVISLGFFFTLGLHYGKKLHPGEAPKEVAGKLEESPEAVPSKDTLDEGAQHSEAGTQDTLKAATQEELAAGALKVNEPKPVDLPTEKVHPATPEAKATKEPATKEATKEAAKEEATEESEPVSASAGKFAIQLGSYPSKKDAQVKIKALVKRGLHPDIRTAVVNNQTRYRVILPGFKTKASADQRGKELHTKRKIENFIVIKSE